MTAYCRGENSQRSIICKLALLNKKPWLEFKTLLQTPIQCLINKTITVKLIGSHDPTTIFDVQHHLPPPSLTEMGFAKLILWAYRQLMSPSKRCTGKIAWTSIKGCRGFSSYLHHYEQIKTHSSGCPLGTVSSSATTQRGRRRRKRRRRGGRRRRRLV